MVLTITMVHGNYLGTLRQRQILYWDAYWGEDNDVWLDLGRSRWVKGRALCGDPSKQYQNSQKDIRSKLCDGIDGAYKGSINSKTSYSILP